MDGPVGAENVEVGPEVPVVCTVEVCVRRKGAGMMVPISVAVVRDVVDDVVGPRGGGGGISG